MSRNLNVNPLNKQILNKRCALLHFHIPGKYSFYNSFNNSLFEKEVLGASQWSYNLGGRSVQWLHFKFEGREKGSVIKVDNVMPQFIIIASLCNSCPNL